MNSPRSRTRPPAALPRAALATVVVTALVFAFTAWTAWTVTPAPSIPTEVSAAADDSATAGMRRSASDADIERVIAHDVFSPRREASAQPYRLAERDEATAVAEEAPTVIEAPALPAVHGTAVDASGATFAMCAVPGGPVVVVRPGDVMGTFTVLSIERARVVFRDADGRRHTVEAIASPAGDEP